MSVSHTVHGAVHHTGIWYNSATAMKHVWHVHIHKCMRGIQSIWPEIKVSSYNIPKSTQGNIGTTETEAIQSPS